MTAVLSAVIAGLVAIIVALLTSRVETRSQAAQLRHEIFLQEQRLRTELRTEYMAEEAINQLLLVSVVKVAVEGKDIVSEVARGVAPYRVCVVRAPLGVVPFEEEVRALQPVVVGLAWL